MESENRILSNRLVVFRTKAGEAYVNGLHQA